MRFPAKRLRFIVIAALVVGLFVLAFGFMGKSRKATNIDVKVPQLSAIATKGKTAFDAYCTQCHGRHAAGTDKGPPLVHKIYVPGHHSDQAFFLAAKIGVRQHHWRFGNMPPQPQVSSNQMQAIVRYVRELQIANGIE